MSSFTTTEVSHDPESCDRCSDAVAQAVATARVTGSVGATFSYNGSSGEVHRATVHRTDLLSEFRRQSFAKE